MKLIVSLLIPLLVGITGGLFTRPEIQGWYATLNKPWFNPPPAVFGPVWTTLYILMGIAMFLVWRSPVPESQKKPALYLYAVQLFFNFFWSILFFRFHQPGAALVWIVIMWVLIFITILRFGKISKAAAWLMVPYIMWVSFASVLNHAIWTLN